jgi:hypothetical protein
VEISTEKGTQKLYVYSGNEPVKGRVKVSVKKGDKIDHQGMRMDFIGQIGTHTHSLTHSLSVKMRLNNCDLLLHSVLTSLIQEMFYDRGNHYEFTSVTQELAPPGSLTGEQTFDFEFSNPEKPFESYNGINVRVR